MADRHHGYDVTVEYSAHFLREIAPDWLRFCIAAQGFEPPESGPGYRYLDLGCGPGFHLCLLAAANPQAHFVGVDFRADHIAQAKGLAAAAGLSNTDFVQADFLDLAAEWPADLGAYDYIVAYGILSWVSADLRSAVFKCIEHASKPGGLVAFGYNCPPGWLTGVPFQHVANELAKTSGPDAALQSAMTMFRRLLSVSAPISQQLSGFKPHLEVFATQPTSYTAHEFLTDNWEPLWHSTVARGLGDDFTYVGSATIAEALLPDSLPPELRTFVVEQDDRSLRQDVQDIVINQQFRRDIFCRGTLRPSGTDIDLQAPIHLFSAPPPNAPVRFKTTFGGLTVDYSAVADIVAALIGGSKTVAELMELKSPVPRHTRSILLSMLEAQMLVVGASHPSSADECQRFNAAVARAVTEGETYRFTAAAALGSGTPASELDLLMLDTWLGAEETADATLLARGLVDRLNGLGRDLRFQGAALEGEQLHSQALRIAQLFLDQGLPKWRRLGVLQ